MNPIIIDVILVVISVLLIFGGYRQGFIRAAGSLLGLVISIGLGIWGVTWLEDLTGFDLTRNPVVFIFTFLVLSVLISQILGLIVSALDLVRKLISIIPFVGLANRVLGMLLGVVQSALLIGALAYVTVSYIPAGGIRLTLLQAELVKAAVSVEQALGLL